MNTKLENEFYTINEVMEILQLSKLTIYRYIKDGKLQSYKFGKSHRIRKEDFDFFLQDHKN